MCLEPMASLAREARAALQVPAAAESAAATRRVVGPALKKATRRSFQQGTRSTSEKTEVLRWVQRQPATGMAEYLKPHLSGKYHAGREEKTRLLVGTAELRLHTRGHRADVPGEDLLCRCCPARVKEGPFHFAFGCQDRADLVHQLRAALEAPPARTDEELFRWLMSTARVGRPAHVFYEHLVRCRARRNASDAANA